MSYAERNLWVQGVVSVVMLAIYVPVVLPHPPTDGSWLWGMLWAIGTSVSAVTVLSICWNLAAGVRRGTDTRPDERDRLIGRVSDRVGQAFVVIAVIIAIVMCAGAAPMFWIAHTLFFGMAVSGVVACASALVMYRTGTI